MTPTPDPLPSPQGRSAETSTDMAVVPRHQWTHDGAEVLIVKCVGEGGRTRGGFVWPLTVGAEVETPDWRGDATCGGGLHGWPWMLAVGDGKEPDYAGTWLVFGASPADVIDLGGKVKARRGVVRYVGSYIQVQAYVHPGQLAWIAQAASGAASAQAASGAASATGWRGAASATGGMGAASATGDASVAVVTGLSGRARAGRYGVIALSWWNAAAGRVEMRCARTGDGQDGRLKPDTWYVLSEEGAFVEANASSRLPR